MLAAVSQNGDALRYASTHLHADKEVVLAAVAQKGDALRYASADLQADKDVVFVAVASCADANANAHANANANAVHFAPAEPKAVEGGGRAVFFV